MEIRITTKQILKALQVLTWIIFAGLCIEAIGILFSGFYTMAINPINAKHSWEELDLSDLYAFDQGYFLVILLIMFIIGTLKAIMFYVIVKLFSAKNQVISQPFSPAFKRALIIISCLAIGIGLFCNIGCGYVGWLTQLKGVKMPNIQALKMAGGDVWLFMAVILFVIVQIIKRGIELQNENDLTI